MKPVEQCIENIGKKKKKIENKILLGNNFFLLLFKII